MVSTIKKRLFVFSILLCMLFCFLYSSSFVFAELYSSNWLVSGSEFNLDGNDFQVFLSGKGLSTKILLKMEGKGEFYNLGDCFSKGDKEVCFTEYELMDNGEQRIKAEFSQVKTTATIGISQGDITSIVGEEIDVDIVATFLDEERPDEIEVLVYFPKEILVKGDGDLSKTDSETQVRYYKSSNVNEIETISLKLNSNQEITYQIVAQLKYTYKNKSKTIFSSTKDIQFKLPYAVTYTINTFNDTKATKHNITVRNTANKKISFKHFFVFFSKDTLYQKPISFTTATDYKGLESELFEGYQRDFALEAEELKAFEISLFPKKEGNYSIITSAEFSRGSKEYKQNISTYSYEFYLAETEKNKEDYTNLSTKCTGIDFNLTSSINESSIYYPGSELDLILYMKNIRNQNITNVKASIFQENSLVNQEFFDKLIRLEKKNIFKKERLVLPYKEDGKYEYKIIIEYSCEQTTEQFSQTKTFTFNLATVQDLTIKKEIEKSEVEEGKEVKVIVSLENGGNSYAYDIYAQEEIPPNFAFEGTTKKKTALDKNTSEVLYTYYVTTPEVESDTDFLLKTTLQFRVNNQTQSRTFEDKITVLQSDKMNVDFSAKADTKGYVFEPSKITFTIKNNDESPLHNLSIYVPKKEAYDQTDKKWKYPILNPGQSITVIEKILPKKDFSNLEGIMLTYFTKSGRKEVKELNISYSLKAARTEFPLVNYEVHVEKKLTGEIISTLTFNNPSKTLAKGETFNIENEPQFLEIPAKKTVTKKYYTTEDFLDYDENIAFLKYEFLGEEYFIYPTSFTKEIAQVAQNENQIEESKQSESVEISTQIRNLVQKDSGSWWWLIKLIVAIVVMIILTIIITPILFSRNKKNQEKPKIDVKHLREVLEKPLQTSNIIDSDIYSSNKIHQQKNNSILAKAKKQIFEKISPFLQSTFPTFYEMLTQNNKYSTRVQPSTNTTHLTSPATPQSSTSSSNQPISSKEDSSLHPSNIFSFDEYETFKKKVEDDIQKKHQEQKRMSNKKNKKFF